MNARLRPVIRSAVSVFAILAGALYFRLLVMTEAADAAWVERVLAPAEACASIAA